METLTEKDRELQQLVFQNMEMEKRHNPYDQEVRQMECIENGDLDGLHDSLKERSVGSPGILAADPLRHEKNLAIIVSALACRAAIRGGISSEAAYSVSDYYINRIEEQTETASVQKLCILVQELYCDMVHKLQLSKKGVEVTVSNPRVHQCKDYIFAHMYEKITVQDVAEALFMDAKYLSELFKRYEGVPLSHYILQEKIGRAKNLLKYSDLSYSEIAASLGFASQSHLGHQFKKMTGQTLHHYRLVYQKTEF